MEGSQWEYSNHLFCSKVSFLNAPHCQFRGVAKVMKQTYLDVLSLNNSKLGDVVDRIYHIDLEIRDTTDTDRSAS
jgi:hypothetical protein